MNPIKIELLTENNQKTYRLSGIFTEADVRNRNGRIYPKDILRESVNDFIQRINNGEKIYAYLEHPPHDQIIKEDSCAIIESVTWEESTGRAFGSVKLLPETRDGKKLINDLDNGSSVGISSRALGSLNEDKVVQPGLKLVTWDLVDMPSCQVCDLSLNESVVAQETLGDYLINEDDKDCGCTFNKLTINEQIKVRKHFIDKVMKVFK